MLVNAKQRRRAFQRLQSGASAYSPGPPTTDSRWQRYSASGWDQPVHFSGDGRSYLQEPGVQRGPGLMPDEGLSSAPRVRDFADAPRENTPFQVPSTPTTPQRRCKRKSRLWDKWKDCIKSLIRPYWDLLARTQSLRHSMDPPNRPCVCNATVKTQLKVLCIYLTGCVFAYLHAADVRADCL